jgi:uncharacterized protein (TIGR02284 family)
MIAEMADDALTILGKLIETCRDGQAGYLDAAEHSRNAELRSYFQRHSMERSRFAGELERVAQNLGESDPSRSPSIANKLHRAWIDVKCRMGAGDASVLASVELGEDNAKHHYQEALRAELPLEVHNIIERQAESVFDAYDQVRTLRGVYPRAA